MEKFKIPKKKIKRILYLVQCQKLQGFMVQLLSTVFPVGGWIGEQIREVEKYLEFLLDVRFYHFSWVIIIHTLTASSDSPSHFILWTWSRGGEGKETGSVISSEANNAQGGRGPWRQVHTVETDKYGVSSGSRTISVTLKTWLNSLYLLRLLRK